MGLEEILGNCVVNQSGAKVSLGDISAKPYVGLYFSAHWCPPCRGFTPTLGEFYNKMKAENKLEIIFVSFDRDEASFKEYFGSMPWLAISFDEKEKREGLATDFDVSGIPQFTLLDNQGKILVKNARGNVEGQPDKFPWA